jgi:hypothetical protein
MMDDAQRVLRYHRLYHFRYCGLEAFSLFNVNFIPAFSFSLFSALAPASSLCTEDCGSLAATATTAAAATIAADAVVVRSARKIVKIVLYSLSIRINRDPINAGSCLSRSFSLTSPVFFVLDPDGGRGPASL